MMGTPEKMFPFVLIMCKDVPRCSYLLEILSFGFEICAKGENLS